MTPKETPTTRRYRSIDDPTAAYPVGALSGIVEELADEDTALSEDASAPYGYSEEDEPEVSPAFLLAALVAGGVLAIAIVSGVAVFVFLL
jgi:hypothetical protein